jgi:flagellar motility protein MotE (MotC chaperone)
LSCRAGRHMRLCNRNLAELLQKMIPESARELPNPIATARATSQTENC